MHDILRLLEKPFDSVLRPAMWQVLEHYGCPNDGMMGRVQHQNGLSEHFPITGGLKQGCVLAPTLFIPSIWWQRSERFQMTARVLILYSEWTLVFSTSSAPGPESVQTTYESQNSNTPMASEPRPINFKTFRTQRIWRMLSNFHTLAVY